MYLNYLEKLSSKIAICSLLILTIVGFVMIFDIAFDLDILPGQGLKIAAGVFSALLFVLTCSTVLISIMLNIKRIVQLLEENND